MGREWCRLESLCVGRGMVAGCSLGNAEGAQHHWSKDQHMENQALQPLRRGMVCWRRMDVPHAVRE